MKKWIIIFTLIVIFLAISRVYFDVNVLKVSRVQFSSNKVPEGFEFRILQISDVRMCLISNADVIDKIGWDSSPLNKYFEHTIFSFDVGVLKPNKKIYDMGLKKMGVEAENAVFIGDGGSGELQGAREMDLKTILVTHFLGDMRSKRINSNREYVDLVVDRFEDIIKYI